MVRVIDKVRLIALQFFCIVFLQGVPNLWRFVRCKYQCCCCHTEGRSRVMGSHQARHMWCLDEYDDAEYDDPAFNGHVGTIVCAFRPERPVPYTRVIDVGPDGNPICIDFFMRDDTSSLKGSKKSTKSNTGCRNDRDESEEKCVGGKATSASAFLLIIPGLASWSGSNYIQRFVWHAHERGFDVGVFNARGLGDTPLVAPRLMSGAWTGDLLQLTRHGILTRDAIHQRCGGADIPIIGIGFSLGGVILSKFIGEEGRDGVRTIFDAAITVNSPLDCMATCIHLNKPVNRTIYQPNMTEGLVEYLRQHRDVLKDIPGLPEEVQALFRESKHEQVFGWIKELYDYDFYINAAINGYRSPEDYYIDISPISWFRHATVPILCINAEDDPVTGRPPIVDMESLISENEGLALLQLPYGGHLGYAKSPLGEWMEEPTYVESLLCDLADHFTSYVKGNKCPAARREPAHVEVCMNSSGD